MPGAKVNIGLGSSTAAGVAGPLGTGETTTGVAILLIVAVSPLLFSRENASEGNAGDPECCDGTVLLRCSPLLCRGVAPPVGGVPGPGLGASPECLEPRELTETFLRIESNLLALAEVLATDADRPSSCCA